MKKKLDVPKSIKNILVVAGEEGFGNSIKCFIEDFLRYSVTTASPTEALRLLQNKAVKFDLLLTSVMMPEMNMNGKALSEAITKLRPDIKVLFMSGCTLDELVKKGILEEEAAFLSKPFTIDDLEAKIIELLS